MWYIITGFICFVFGFITMAILASGGRTDEMNKNMLYRDLLVKTKRFLNFIRPGKLRNFYLQRDMYFDLSNDIEEALKED